MTQRELDIMFKSNYEKRLDEYEDMAEMAMMNRQAYHAKKLSKKQIFKRPVDLSKGEDKALSIKEQSDKDLEWLSNIKEFSGFDLGN